MFFPLVDIMVGHLGHDFCFIYKNLEFEENCGSWKKLHNFVPLTPLNFIRVQNVQIPYRLDILRGLEQNELLNSTVSKTTNSEIVRVLEYYDP